ncbi:MAG TPA: MaoC family dehydratase [Mycobacteriales bacterium]|jgi:Acyl dehydratase
MRHLRTPHEFLTAVGQSLGVSAAHTIEQARIDQFADATEDRQWIHVDPDRARSGPFGSTVVHGYLTLSLLPVFLSEVFTVGGTAMILNYGLDRVRFPAPAPVNSELVASVEVLSAEERGADVQVVLRVTVNRTGTEKPCCVADSVLRFVTDNSA